MPIGQIEPAVRAEHLVLRGRVQGFGVRPAIARLAGESALAGSVCNTAEGVRIEIEGPESAVRTFGDRLIGALPPGAVVERLERSRGVATGRGGFRIEDSRVAGPMAAVVPTDRASCPRCFAEVHQRQDRRFRYPFTTCTACGPRYSIIDAMPYDRQRTSMNAFDLCDDCGREHDDLHDRRLHSQTNACPSCGPCVWLMGGGVESGLRGDEAIDRAVAAIGRGLIVGLKGIGGYQWLVDATDAAGVRRLRGIKGRPSKPLAVMVADLQTATSLGFGGQASAVSDEQAVVSDEQAAERGGEFATAERQWLRSPANPIVILRRREEFDWAVPVCGALKTIGVMLPSTPLHDLLARRCARPLVVTSGNLEGDPIEFETPGDASVGRPDLGGDTAVTGEGPDVWLEHDRRIARPIDDSVVRVAAGHAIGIRLGRGLAPYALDIPTEMLKAAEGGGPLLAVGGHQKVAVSVYNGAQAVLGPHLGDLETLAARQRFERHVDSFCELYQMRPGMLVHDRHPDYFTTRWAGERGLPTFAVQHHHAHVVAMMIEQRWLDREVLGVAWDGTGYGDDGTIWGGEFLVAGPRSYRRVGHLLPFPLVGGELAVREPWRVAVSLVHQTLGAEAASRLRFDGIDPVTVGRLVSMLGRPADRCDGPVRRTTSVGRLCDGVAALVLGVAKNGHDGQAATLLESACDVEAEGVDEAEGGYVIPLIDDAMIRCDWRPMIEAIVADLAAGIDGGVIACRFHRGLARSIHEMSRRFADLPLVLAGGCFQNRVLVEAVVEGDTGARRPLGIPGIIPPGDGGLSAGQLAVAIARRGAPA